MARSTQQQPKPNRTPAKKTGFQYIPAKSPQLMRLSKSELEDMGDRAAVAELTRRRENRARKAAVRGGKKS